MRTVEAVKWGVAGAKGGDHGQAPAGGRGLGGGVEFKHARQHTVQRGKRAQAAVAFASRHIA